MSGYITRAELRNFLRATLAETGMTQSAYADSIGVTEQIISKFLTGKTAPSKKILNALGCQRAELYQIKSEGN